MGRPNKVRYREDRDAWVSKIDGVLHTLAKGKRNRAAAVKALHELLVAKAKGLPAPERTISVGELCDRLSTWTAEHRSGLTSEWYDRHLQAFVDHIGYQTVADTVRPFHVSEWVESQGWGQSMSVSVGKGTTLGAQWAPAERLRRDPFDPLHGSTRFAGISGDGSVLAWRRDRRGRGSGSIHGTSRWSCSQSARVASKRLRPVAEA